MSSFEPAYSSTLPGIVTIEWPGRIEEGILMDLLSFRQVILQSGIKEVKEVVSGYHSLWVYHESTDSRQLLESLKALYPSSENEIIKTRDWNIPISYDPTFATDLDHIKKVTGLSGEEIIKRHVEGRYRVFMIGFLPGFLYLGGMDETLAIPRKNHPDPKIRKGSVGIAGNQTGIYPIECPGGWHILGRTPVELFTPGMPPYCPVKAGDGIVFRKVDLQAFEDLRKEVAQGNYKWTYE